MWQKIEDRWKAAVDVYPLLKEEMETLQAEMTDQECLWMKAIYAACGVNDWVSISPQDMLLYVRASKRAYEEITYIEEIPEDIFLKYVLAVRVNNEWLDGSRMWLYENLRDRVLGKTMEKAALEVNYWCYEKATYTPTDDRTIAPFGMCKRAKGRCGEESTLLVSALRAVGIPARQCYAPRWAHCDDNHAWVEVWIEGKWHYMGACEPEEVLDKGWFTAAASKAMLVRAWEPDFGATLQGFCPIHCTGHYGDVKKVFVQVCDHGVPKSGVMVKFQLVNYAELYTLYEEKTDNTGMACFESGLGDLYVCAKLKGRMVGYKIDLRKEDTLILELADAHALEEEEESFDLIPPKERVDSLKADPQAMVLRHKERMKICESVREQYEAGFAKEDSKWLQKARGNQEELRRFLNLDEFTEEQKESILETLKEKDFADMNCECLTGYLRASLPYQSKYPYEIWQQGVLAPRVDCEMILDIRERICDILKEKNFSYADEVAKWMEETLCFIDEYGMTDRFPDFGRCLKGKVCPKSKKDILLVEICRALGIAARLNPATKTAEEWSITEKIWKPVREGEEEKTGTLCLLYEAEEPMLYAEHISIAHWDESEERYVTLDYQGMHLIGKEKLLLKEGVYRILTSRRQIDGSVSVWMKSVYVEAKKETECKVLLREDQTEEKKKSQPLPHVFACPIEEENGTLREVATGEENGTGSILIYAEPGKEPTEHLFQELLEWKEEYNRKGYWIDIVLYSRESYKNETLQKVKRELTYSRIWLAEDEEGHREMAKTMGVGDERLPFAVAIGEDKKGRFAFANYNIRTAQILLHLLK